MNLGVQAYSDGRWDDAVMRYRRSEEAFLPGGNTSHAAFAAANLAEVLIGRGALEEAEAVARDARRALRASRLAVGAIFAEIQLGRLAILRGELEQAIAGLELIVAEARSIGHSGMVLEAAIQLADAQVRHGAAEAALATLAEAERRGGDEAALTEAPVRRVQASALAALGRLDEAGLRLDEALRAARAQGLLYEELQILQARAGHARLVGASPEERELQEADRLLQLLGLSG